VLSPTGQEGAGADGERPGVRVLGIDPATGDEITLRTGRFGDYVQQGEGEKPKRSSLPKGLSPDDLTLEKAIALLSLPREIAKHPTSGEPILAGIGRYGSYVQHGKTYANLGKDDDVLEIGGNRAIDLIVAKESGAGQPRFGAGSGRALGEHPTLGGAVSVKQGRFGAYVNHGKVNATLPKGTSVEALTLDEAVAALAAKAAGGGSGGRMLGEHPDGGPITVRDGRFGAYVNWGRVNATIPKSIALDAITLQDAIELIAEREGKPAKPTRKPAAAKAPAKEKPPAAKKAPAKGKAAVAKPAPPAERKARGGRR
jgi:DNA topoisomerase-1